MLHCFDPIRTLSFWAILVRLSLAVVCGGVIGAERETKRRPAGLPHAHPHLPRRRHHHAHEPVPAALPAFVYRRCAPRRAGHLRHRLHRRWHDHRHARQARQGPDHGRRALGRGHHRPRLRRGLCRVRGLATLVVLVVELVLIRLEFKLTSKNTDLTLYIEYAHAVCMESVLALLRERRVQIRKSRDQPHRRTPTRPTRRTTTARSSPSTAAPRCGPATCATIWLRCRTFWLSRKCEANTKARADAIWRPPLLHFQ